MILEVAILNIKEGLEKEFERDFKIAGKYISSIKGYKGHTLKKCVEEKNKYILLANWKTIEDHNIGFRKSNEYLMWKELLHHYYKPFPIVQHYETIINNQATANKEE